MLLLSPVAYDVSREQFPIYSSRGKLKTRSRKPIVILHELAGETLRREGGAFGWVLQLVRERKSRSSEFRELLGCVVGALEEMPSVERLRWQDLLSYIMAMIYHERSPSEVPEMQETIKASVRADALRQEVLQMGKTYAEELIECPFCIACLARRRNRCETDLAKSMHWWKSLEHTVTRA